MKGLKSKPDPLFFLRKPYLATAEEARGDSFVTAGNYSLVYRRSGECALRRYWCRGGREVEDRSKGVLVHYAWMLANPILMKEVTSCHVPIRRREGGLVHPVNR
jgi:hypothetical protein|uniref:Uncharacterized protein n=1 Tax=Picea glauca TaxID=3330 RepID=A0A101LWL1_PICGL|nr:hypothetical protein ABT39_MTgene1347 [Picea glauca]QHR89499.1 hypothetical protein Q903MT_gene3520 [Picea sitchensis]